MMVLARLIEDCHDIDFRSQVDALWLHDAFFFFFFLSLISLIADGITITILPVVTKDLPISPRFTPYDFLSRCKFSTLTTR